jgi:hypothetical protein
MGSRKRQTMLSAMRQHNSSSLANLKFKAAPMTGSSKQWEGKTADQVIAHMAKLLEPLMQVEAGPMVIVAGAGIMSLAEAVDRFGDRLVQVKSVEEMLRIMQPAASSFDPPRLPVEKGDPLCDLGQPDAQGFVSEAHHAQVPGPCKDCGGIMGRHKPVEGRPAKDGTRRFINCPTAEAVIKAQLGGQP